MSRHLVLRSILAASALFCILSVTPSATEAVPQARSIEKSTKPPLRVGVVGLVHTHVHWILGRENRGDIEIVGIVEPNRDLAARYAEQH